METQGALEWYIEVGMPEYPCPAYAATFEGLHVSAWPSLLSSLPLGKKMLRQFLAMMAISNFRSFFAIVVRTP